MPKVTYARQERAADAIRIVAAVVVCIIFMIPVVWMFSTAFKPRRAIISTPPQVFFKPTLEGFVGLFWKRSTLTEAQMEEYRQRTDLQWWDRVALEQGLAIVRPSDYVGQLRN